MRVPSSEQPRLCRVVLLRHDFGQTAQSAASDVCRMDRTEEAKDATKVARCGIAATPFDADAMLMRLAMPKSGQCPSLPPHQRC